MAGIPVKRGSALSIDMQITEDATGLPVDLTGWAIACYVRNRGCLVEKLGVTITDATAGRFTITSPSTKDWPVGRLFSDLAQTIPNQGLTYSEGFYFDVQETVTYDD